MLVWPCTICPCLDGHETAVLSVERRLQAIRGTRAAPARPSIHSANLSSDTREPNMTDTPEYTPPEVWVWEKGDSPEWRYSHTNRPIAGATHEKELPRGKHPLQLYSLATPN